MLGIDSRIFSRIPLAVVGLVMLARGIYAYLPGPFSRASEPFASLNATYFSPLVLILGLGLCLAGPRARRGLTFKLYSSPPPHSEPMIAELILAALGPVADDCTWNGIPLHGEVQVVESFPDIRVQIVSSFPDLKVKQVSSFPDDCGEWTYVTSFADFTIQFVDSFPDVRIKYVESFPGLP